MARHSNKEKILDAGLEVVRQRGYNAAGIRDITTAAGVPQGSFSNHFVSKEEFGVQILDRYFADVETVIARTLTDRDRSPVERLREYFDVITDRMAARDWRHGCLIGNLSLDSAEHSELLRGRLAEIFDVWRQPFADCLEEAATAGQIHLTIPAAEMADFLLASWQGALLRMKVTRSPEPLERFKRVVFASLLLQPVNPVPHQPEGHLT